MAGGVDAVDESPAALAKLAKAYVTTRRLKGVPTLLINDPESNLYGYLRISSHKGDQHQYRRLPQGEPRHWCSGEKQLFWSTPRPEESGSVVWLTEGPADSWALALAGAQHSCSVMGSDLTDNMAYELRNQFVLVLFDNDGAGYKGARRARDLLIEFNVPYRLIELPPAWDTNDPSHAWEVSPSLLKEFVHRYERRHTLLGKSQVDLFLKREVKSPPLFRTGWQGVDNLLGHNFRGGSPLVIQGQPEQGKTSLLVALANAAIHDGNRVAIHESELLPREWWARVASTLPGAPGWNEIESNFGVLSNKQKTGLRKISDSMLVVTGGSLQRFHQAARRFGANVLMYDYLQAIKGALGEDNEVSTAKVSGLMRMILEHCTEEQVFSIIVSSMPRASYGTRAMAGKYSGDIDYGGAVILTLEKTLQFLRLSVVKHRRGDHGGPTLLADFAHQRFEDFSGAVQEE
jgi:hypothetical protein